MTDINPNLKSADTLSMESNSQLQSQTISNQTMGLEDDFMVIGSDGTLNPMGEQPRSDITPRQRTQLKLDAKNETIREQIMAIDTSTALQTQFREKAQEYIRSLVKVNEKLVQIQTFESRKEPPLSITETAIIKEKPGVLLRQTAIKKDIKLAQKQVDDAAKQLLKERADLDVMRTDYEQCFNFAKDIGFETIGFATTKSNEFTPQIDVLSDPLANPACNPSYLDTSLQTERMQPVPPVQQSTTLKPIYKDPLLMANDLAPSIDTQYSDGMLMPAFQSKAVNQRSLKKMLQELEGRLHWPITIEMDRELCALSEIQAALVTDHPQLESYATLVKAIRNQLVANRVMLDRITIVQLEMRLIPMASRVAIKITISSFSHNPGLKKELYKPAHFETRKKLFMCLPGEIKPDPSSTWRNPNKVISIRAAAGRAQGVTHNAQGRRVPGYNPGYPVLQRGRGRARGRQFARPAGRAPNYGNNNFSRPRSSQFRNNRGGQQETSKQRASRLKLCFTCSRPGHQNKDCPQKRLQPVPANLA